MGISYAVNLSTDITQNERQYKADSGHDICVCTVAQTIIVKTDILILQIAHYLSNLCIIYKSIYLLKT